jgi:hypothetical protein
VPDNPRARDSQAARRWPLPTIDSSSPAPHADIIVFGRSLRRLLSGAVLVPLLALAATAGHALALRCRWTGQTMELARCCPGDSGKIGNIGSSAPSPDRTAPELRAQGCCSLERADLDRAAAPPSSLQPDARLVLAPLTLLPLADGPPPLASPRLRPLPAPRPPPLAQRLALKRSRLI